MRNFAYGAATATAVVLVAGLLLSHPFRFATALSSAPAQASDVVDIGALEATIDVRALPTLDVDDQD